MKQVTVTIAVGSLFLALSPCSVMAQSTSSNEIDLTETSLPDMAEIVGFVEKALVAPLADLERQARKGYASDKLIYGLALKAGREKAGQDKKAKKWIRKAANSFKGPSSSGPLPIGSRSAAALPAPNLEVKSYSGGVAIPTISTGGRTTSGFDSALNLSTLNPDIILIAEACVDALLIAPDPKANMFACSGEAEYRRLLALMPKSEN